MLYKKLLVSIAFLALLTSLLAACSIHDTVTNGPTVHMGSANFVQTTITIQKGDSITLVDDVAVQHIIDNGTWDKSVAKPSKESGAPVYNQTFNGNDSATLGPFTTSGTFHYYCTIHPNMNLAITVQ